MNSNFECDTNSLRDTAKQVNGYVVDLKNDLNKLYNGLDDVRNEGWVGTNAEKYSSAVLQDKPDYVDFMDGIKEIADELSNLSDELEEVTNKVEKDSEGI